MALTPRDWHDRFLVQAQWTRALRAYFFDLLKSESLDRILDIGCGTGALLPDLQALSPAEVYGADLKIDHLDLAAQNSPDSHLIGANVHHLPFPDSSFDLVLCHYFLMWTGDPKHAIKEMQRVTRKGGIVAAFAEPDYGGRIDHPPEFIRIRDLQINSLLEAGADPRMGRRLKCLFSSPDFSDVSNGVYEGKWNSAWDPVEVESEWQMLENDLKGMLSSAELNALKEHDQAARKKGTRLVYVPTFYSWGRITRR
jgi:ubiquinone/menaquinone biosynthesis C-methylase UbiE